MTKSRLYAVLMTLAGAGLIVGLAAHNHPILYGVWALASAAYATTFYGKRKR